MRNLISIFWVIIYALLAVNLCADEDDDIFADIDRMEIDTEFKDDFLGFDNKTHVTAHKYVGTSRGFASSIVNHPYDAYSERLWVRDGSFAGGLVSQETIASVYHMTLFPQVHFKIWQINSFLGLPMRFPIYDNI